MLMNFIEQVIVEELVMLGQKHIFLILKNPYKYVYQ